MRGIEGEQVLLRIILSESRTHDGAPLHRRLLEVLRTEGLAGATVWRDGTSSWRSARTPSSRNCPSSCALATWKA